MSKQKANIAILGATGVVGREITKIVDELNVDFGSIKFLSSAKSSIIISFTLAERDSVKPRFYTVNPVLLCVKKTWKFFNCLRFFALIKPRFTRLKLRAPKTLILRWFWLRLDTAILSIARRDSGKSAENKRFWRGSTESLSASSARDIFLLKCFRIYDRI